MQRRQDPGQHAARGQHHVVRTNRDRALPPASLPANAAGPTRPAPAARRNASRQLKEGKRLCSFSAVAGPWERLAGERAAAGGDLFPPALQVLVSTAKVPAALQQSGAGLALGRAARPPQTGGLQHSLGQQRQPGAAGRPLAGEGLV